MKKILVLFTIFFTVLITATAQGEDSAKIVFYREYNYVGSAIPFKVYKVETLLTKLKTNTYYTYKCKPGRYFFSFDLNENSITELNVVAGKTYYLRYGLKTGYFQNTPEILIVDSLSAEPLISSGVLKDITNNPPVVRKKNRLGINMNIGFGLYNTPMATTTTNEESKISFGGGAGFGLTYGHEFAKHFDLAASLYYQFNSLTPYLSNAEVTTSHGYASITPSVIIPIHDGEYMRVKIGGGLDYYFSNSMKIEMSKLENGFNDTFNYDKSLGYHASLNFEMNVNPNWMINYGLKWYTVNYKYVNSERGYYPTTNNLTNPNGSGIDFILGIAHNF